MKSLKTLLREADPIAREPAPTPDEIGRMRRAVLDAGPPARGGGWVPPLAIATALGLLLVSGAVSRLGRPQSQPAPHPEPDRMARSGGAGAVVPATDERRQLQFATPGGTRVVWVFDSTFDER